MTRQALRDSVAAGQRGPWEEVGGATAERVSEAELQPVTRTNPTSLDEADRLLGDIAQLGKLHLGEAEIATGRRDVDTPDLFDGNRRTYHEYKLLHIIRRVSSPFGLTVE